MTVNHTLTAADQKAGGKARVKSARILAKAQRKAQEREMIMVLLANPVVVSSLLYLGVGFLRGTASAPVDKSPITSQFMTLWKKNFGSFLQTVGIPANAFSASPSDALGIDALQAALLVNIASGGNLAGVLSSSSGIISKLIPALALK